MFQMKLNIILSKDGDILVLTVLENYGSLFLFLYFLCSRQVPPNKFSLNFLREKKEEEQIVVYGGRRKKKCLGKYITVKDKSKQ